MKEVIVFTADKNDTAISGLLTATGYNVSVHSEVDNCIQAICSGNYTGLCFDIIDRHDHIINCFLVCSQIKSIDPRFPAILLIPKGDISTAVKAAKMGLKHVFEKPLQQEDVSAIVDIFLSSEKQQFIPLAVRLTQGEKKIIKYILRGHTNKEISESLNKSIRTVEEHRAGIMRKLEVDNAADLLNRTLQTGLIKPDELFPPQDPN